MTIGDTQYQELRDILTQVYPKCSPLHLICNMFTHPYQTDVHIAHRVQYITKLLNSALPCAYYSVWQDYLWTKERLSIFYLMQQYLDQYQQLVEVDAAQPVSQSRLYLKCINSFYDAFKLNLIRYHHYLDRFLLHENNAIVQKTLQIIGDAEQFCRKNNIVYINWNTSYSKEHTNDQKLRLEIREHAQITGPKTVAAKQPPANLNHTTATLYGNHITYKQPQECTISSTDIPDDTISIEGATPVYAQQNDSGHPIAKTY